MMDVVGHEPTPPNRGWFKTTRWSVVRRIQDFRPEERRHAWGEIFEIYWYPLYVFCRRRGSSENDATDLIQGFFTHLLAGEGLNSVTPEKGLFRSYLLSAFRNYVSNEFRKEDAIRRGGQDVILNFSNLNPEIRYSLESKTEESPERAFERNWAEALLGRARQRLAEEYENSTKAELFAMLQPHLAHEGEASTQAEIGMKLNLSAQLVRKSLERMRRRFGNLILEEIAATVNDTDEVEDELRHLLNILGAKP